MVLETVFGGGEGGRKEKGLEIENVKISNYIENIQQERSIHNQRQSMERALLNRKTQNSSMKLGPEKTFDFQEKGEGYSYKVGGW